MKGFLGGSGLPVDTLAKIWYLRSLLSLLSEGYRTLSDQDEDNSLSKREYIICRFLVLAVQQKEDLPSKLPSHFIQSLDGASSGPPSRSSTPAAGAPVTTSSSPTVSTGSQQSDPGLGSTKGDPYSSISPELYRQFVKTFKEVQEDGMVSGSTALEVFGQSGLENDLLAQVWALADMDQDNSLKYPDPTSL